VDPGGVREAGREAPTEEELKKFLWDTLNSGKVIPGYGHAVLRKTTAVHLADGVLPEEPAGLPMFKLVNMIYKVGRTSSGSTGRRRNPWPNVDAQSGVIQWYYGLTEYDFYTVLFGVGRALGVLANITWDRALGYALERRSRSRPTCWRSGPPKGPQALVSDARGNRETERGPKGPLSLEGVPLATISALPPLAPGRRNRGRAGR